MQTKNPELEQLMEEHGLTAIKVSELIDVPYRTVVNWRRNEGLSPRQHHAQI